MYTLGLLIVSFSCVLAQRVLLVPKEVTIDAAFRYNRDLFLVSGDEFMAVSSEGFERYVRLRTGDTEVPVIENLQAAVSWPNKPLVYFFSPRLSYRNNQTSRTSKIRSYGRPRRFLQDGGPDAAAYRSGMFYIFKGCQHVAQRHTLWHLGTPQPNNDLGLPCDIDAAWTDADTRGMTILKGDQIWEWREELVGPRPFDEVYHIWSWTLTPMDDDRFHL